MTTFFAYNKYNLTKSYKLLDKAIFIDNNFL